jgi:membrane-associated phospholipid phosphatase
MLTKPEKRIHAYFLEHDAFFNTKVDSLFKWIPYAATFTAHLFGARTRSGWLRQILVAGAAEGIRYLITDSIKNISTERRPLPYVDHRSFPSGHTSSSFAGACFMCTELGESMPVLSVAGYACAVTTAVIRLMKSRHWLKDVMAGAVIGVASVKITFAIADRIRARKREEVVKREEIDSAQQD